MEPRSGVIDVAGPKPPLSEKEDDDRILGQPKLIESIRDTSDAFIHAVNHCRVGRIVVPGMTTLRAVSLDQLRLRLNRRVDAIVRQVQEERPVVMRVEEADCFVGQSISEILTGFSRFQIRQRPIAPFVRMGITRRRSPDASPATAHSKP